MANEFIEDVTSPSRWSVVANSTDSLNGEIDVENEREVPVDTTMDFPPYRPTPPQMDMPAYGPITYGLLPANHPISIQRQSSIVSHNTARWLSSFLLQQQQILPPYQQQQTVFQQQHQPHMTTYFYNGQLVPQVNNKPQAAAAHAPDKQLHSINHLPTASEGVVPCASSSQVSPPSISTQLQQYNGGVSSTSVFRHNNVSATVGLTSQLQPNNAEQRGYGSGKCSYNYDNSLQQHMVPEQTTVTNTAVEEDGIGNSEEEDGNMQRRGGPCITEKDEFAHYGSLKMTDKELVEIPITRLNSIIEFKGLSDKLRNRIKKRRQALKNRDSRAKRRRVINDQVQMDDGNDKLKLEVDSIRETLRVQSETISRYEEEMKHVLNEFQRRNIQYHPLHPNLLQGLMNKEEMFNKKF